ncbi:hypothetical protein [Streptacidiphilus rugosus]|uniref:hypothetical protein n=1 Tax=Streptacidiphilus rugosus TaxID=405783 RepID=UPI00055B7675|nr:hypothetical protein [Streptacidiphilus rugosus]
MTTLVILHRASLGELPYGQWLGDTGHRIVRIGDTELPGFADTAAAELAVLRTAARTPVAGVIALHPDDQIRAGSLRDHLCLPGQTRDQALAGADLILAGELLAAAGVPTLPRAAAGRIPDLYRAAHAWGYPLAVRRRRGAERGVVAELTDEAALRAFARGGLTEGERSTAALVVEPMTLGERHRGPGLPVTDAALTALAPSAGHPLEVDAVRDAHGAWVVDRVRYTGHTAPTRALVRAQAGVEGPSPMARRSTNELLETVR